jgi:3-deoxy-7-phosphoheptulonate synthase
MLVIMETSAAEEDIQHVIDRMIALGFDVHRSSGMKYTVLGGIGSPRDVDLREFKMMDGVREAIRITSRWRLAARAVNPAGSRVRIGDFEIGGDEFVRLPGASMIREVTESSEVRVLSAHGDALLVPSGAMENGALLRELGAANRPVILKRGECSSIEDWLVAAEKILEAGNRNVVLCESGVRTFAGGVLDVGAIAELRTLTHLPVIAAPGDVTNKPDLLEALTKAAMAAGAHGVLG